MERNNEPFESETSDQDLMPPPKYGVDDNDQSKVVVVQSSSSKSKPFSNEAEIALLQTVGEYLLQHSILYENIKWSEFYGPIKTRLKEITNYEYLDTEISKKLQLLKTKYTKGKAKNGNAHESQLFELSKKIWNEDNKKVIRNDDVPAAKKKKKRRGDEFRSEDLGPDYLFLYMSFEDEIEERAKAHCHLIGRKKARQLNFEFAELNKEYLSLTAKKTETDKLFRDLHVLKNFN